MTKQRSPAETYLQAVRRQLDAPGKDRERLLHRMTGAVSVYAEENPEAGEEELTAVFGTPEKCAAELLAECDPARLAAARRRRRRLLAAVIAALLMLLATLAAAFVYLGRHQLKYVDVYITEDSPDMGDSGL